MIKTANKNKTLTDLEACDCRWPIGDPRQEGFHFCGAQSVLGRPYCQQHWAMSYDAMKPRHKATTPVPRFLTRAA